MSLHSITNNFQIPQIPQIPSIPSQIGWIAIRMPKKGFDLDPVEWNQGNPRNPRSNWEHWIIAQDILRNYPPPEPVFKVRKTLLLQPSQTSWKQKLPLALTRQTEQLFPLSPLYALAAKSATILPKTTNGIPTWCKRRLRPSVSERTCFIIPQLEGSALWYLSSSGRSCRAANFQASKVREDFVNTLSMTV